MQYFFYNFYVAFSFKQSLFDKNVMRNIIFF